MEQEKPTVNLLSYAHVVKGQGVASSFEEFSHLINDNLSDLYSVTINSRKKADIMHYNTVNPTFFLRSILARKKSINVCHVHMLPETLEESLGMPKLFRRIFYSYLLRFYRSMDELIVVNKFFFEALKRYGVDESRITYIPNFVSRENFHPLNKEETLAIRERYGYSKDDFIVLSVGQLLTRKGVAEFIETARMLPDIKFLWAGGFSFKQLSSGHNEIGKLLKDLPENASFPGIIERSEMNALYNMADVMFMPSHEELFPMALLEAMNCKKPLLLRDLDLYKDIFFDFYEKGITVNDYVRIISRMSTDSDYRAYCSMNAWRGHLFYSKEHVISQWRGCYEKYLVKHRDKRT